MTLETSDVLTHVGASLARFREIRLATVSWTEALEPGDYFLQSMPDASPIAWHLAHTTWFFEEFLLSKCEDDFEPFDPAFQFLFNSYYEAVGDRVPRHQRGLMTRPGTETILRYRRSVEDRVGAVLSGLSARSSEPDLSKDAAEALRILEIGLQHEQQHQELMVTDLKHGLSCNPLAPSLLGPRAAEPALEDGPGDSSLSFVRLEGGLFRIGHHPAAGFGFDNESPSHLVYLAPFELADRAVTAGEWIEFIEAGGYQDPRWWLSAGWARIRSLEDPWTAPLYWKQRDGGWVHFTAFGEQPLDLAEAVCHVSYYEADAYARFRGCRLPTEFEWEVAARSPSASERALSGRLRDSGRFHPGRACSQGMGASPGKLRQMRGDVWEWTSSAYAAYPGYRPDEGALGEYNGKFMSGQFVLRGGSCATPADHLRDTYRNFFPADARWQFSGLRLARDS